MTAGARDVAWGGSGGGGPPTSPPTYSISDFSVAGDLYVRGGSPWYDSRAFGAVGDGTTDDTVALQAAITASVAATGYALLPAGTYLTSQLTVPNTCAFLGQGYGQTTLRAKTGTAGPLINVTGGVSSKFGGFTVDMANAPTLDAIAVNNASLVSLRDMTISQGARGVKIAGSSSEAHLDNLRLLNQTVAGVEMNCDSVSNHVLRDISGGRDIAGTTAAFISYIRTTATDTGAIYLKNVGCGRSAGTITAGLSASSTAANCLAFMFLDQCAFDSCTNAYSFNNIQHVRAVNSFGSGSDFTCLVNAGGDMEFIGNFFQSSNGSFSFTGAPANIACIGNWCNLATAFQMPVANPPTGLYLAGNRVVGTLTNDFAKLALASSNSNYTTGTLFVTHSAGLPQQSLRLQDGAAGTPTPSKHLRVGSLGELQFVNDAFTTIIASLTDSGQLRTSDGVQTKSLSGAGKVTVADGDFSATPPDGTIAVVRNTTDSTVRIGARSNGAWKVVQIL